MNVQYHISGKSKAYDSERFLQASKEHCCYFHHDFKVCYRRIEYIKHAFKKKLPRQKSCC